MVQAKKIQLQTHRFLFSDGVVDCLNEFAQIHQYDERKVFKSEWQTYLEVPENKELLKNEADRLINEGFEGDPYDKFFKSVRYYYRKKLAKKSSDDEKSPRKEYETIGSEILRDMDEHIKSQIASNINNKDSLLLVSKVSPAESFDDYCNKYKSLILEETLLAKNGKNEMAIGKADIEAMISRFKKTYKNRFYKIRTVLTNA